MNIIKIATACATECVRQHVGLDRVSTLIEGYEKALEGRKTNRYPDLATIMELAGIIEPDSRGVYRTTPVTFATGRGGASADTIARQMSMLFDSFTEDTDANQFAFNYVDIHPLTDGNGRTGFVLYNWVNDTLDDPKPLPYWNWQALNGLPRWSVI